MSETLSVEQTAERLGIGRQAAYAAVRNGEIPAIRIGSRYRISKLVIDRMLAGEHVGTPSGTAA